MKINYDLFISKALIPYLIKTNQKIIIACNVKEDNKSKILIIKKTKKGFNEITLKEKAIKKILSNWDKN